MYVTKSGPTALANASARTGLEGGSNALGRHARAGAVHDVIPLLLESGYIREQRRALVSITRTSGCRFHLTAHLAQGNTYRLDMAPATH